MTDDQARAAFEAHMRQYTCGKEFIKAAVQRANKADRERDEAREDLTRKIRDVIAGCGHEPDEYEHGPLQAVDDLRAQRDEAYKEARRLRKKLADPDERKAAREARAEVERLRVEHAHAEGIH